MEVSSLGRNWAWMMGRDFPFSNSKMGLLISTHRWFGLLLPSAEAAQSLEWEQAGHEMVGESVKKFHQLYHRLKPPFDLLDHRLRIWAWCQVKPKSRWEEAQLRLFVWGLLFFVIPWTTLTLGTNHDQVCHQTFSNHYLSFLFSNLLAVVSQQCPQHPEGNRAERGDTSGGKRREYRSGYCSRVPG